MRSNRKRSFACLAFSSLLCAVGFAAQAGAKPIVELVLRGSPPSVLGDTFTIDVILINDRSVIAGTTSVGMSQTGIVEITSAVNTSPAGLSGVAFSSGVPNGPTGFFGGLNLSGSLAPGTYDMGDITYQLVGRGISGLTLRTIYTPGIDDWYDTGFNNVTPDVFILPIPEPGSALLLGLGLAGLASFRGPRRPGA